MIYDKLSNVLRYKGIHPNLDLALDYVHENLAVMPEKVEIKGKEVHGFICEYETIPASEGFFEAHELYADIQILRSGHERISVTDISELEVTGHKPEKDFWSLTGPDRCVMDMDNTVFLVVLPGDAHKLKIQIDGPEHVQKSVFKVKMK